MNFKIIAIISVYNIGKTLENADSRFFDKDFFIKYIIK